MEIVLVGVSHKTAPVETRERLAVLEGHVPAAIEGLLGTGFVRECSILSTCNRTELYAAGDAAGHVADAIVTHLSHRHGIARDELLPHLFHRFNEEAVRHLFTVSSGLDSMIVGEGQILSQVRKAHQFSLDNQSAGLVLGKLFERAIHVGKRARTETRIAQGATSVSFAAVELARKIYGDLSRKHVLVVGTGKMGMLTLKLLVTAGVARISVLSRREESARRVLADFENQVECSWGSLDRLTDELASADIVISCTASPTPVITAPMVKSILRRRKYRPLFIVDIAVPRDVEAAVNELENVYLYNVDDLSSVVADSLAGRSREMERVRAIIEDEIQSFTRFYTTLETVPAIKRLRTSFESRRAREVAALVARERLTEAERDRMEAFSRALVARLLHDPTVRMKEIASKRNVHEGLHFLLELFADGEGAAENFPPSAKPVNGTVSEVRDPQEEIAP
jgi:glutamyl-tRNA reductase